MRITERQLKRVIRQVIKESLDGSMKSDLLNQMSHAARMSIKNAERDMETSQLANQVSDCMSSMPELSAYGFESGVTHQDVMLMDEYLNSVAGSPSNLASMERKRKFITGEY